MMSRPQMKMLFLLMLSLVPVLTAARCTSNTDPELESKYKIGGLYSVVGVENDFNIMKVIAITKGVVHVRIFKNKFNTRPTTIDSSTLSLGGIDDPEGFGLRHMPMDRETFEKSQPVFIKQDPVTDEELQGFTDWKNATGN